MSADFFRVIQGLDIFNEATSKNASIFQGDGLPGGDGDIQDAAPIGSIYLRTNSETNNQQLYWKYTTSNNSSADWKVAADKDYVDSVAAGLSWREPARVRDNTLYADSSAFPVTGTIDGVSLSDGDRVLFTNVTTTSANNVWIWHSGTTSWSEDINQESDGDALLVQEGTSADQQWVYDGSVWVLFGSSSNNAELGYIRTFVGKTGPGSENPTYSSTNVVTQAGSLESAIGEVDAAFGDGAITTDGGNYALSDDLAWGAGGTLDVTEAFNDVNNAIGNRSYSENNFIADGESVAASLEKVDVELGALSNQTQTFTGSNVDASGTVTLDTLAVANATQVKWLIQVRENGTPANIRSSELHAITDGTSTDHTEYAVLRLGSAIAGFDLEVDINGTDLRLRFTATNPVDYVVKRVGYSAF